MNSRVLKSKMSLYGDNNKTLANKLNITPSALSRKINNLTNFSIEEIKFIRKEYELSDNEIIKIFFDWILLNGKKMKGESIKKNLKMVQ